MSKTYGLDIGTMYIVSSGNTDSDNLSEIKKLRNMFLEVDTELTSLSEIENTGLDYVKINDGEKDRVFIISEDCLKFSQIFGQNPRRPMSNGVVSRNELDAQLVLKLMIENLLGKTEDGLCVYSVPALPVDMPEIKTLYHEKIFSKILTSCGYENKPMNEGMAVVYSNCAPEKFSGIGISWGCGMTNVAVSYRGISAFNFSISRGGDWIDKAVSDSLGIPTSRITGLKEKKLNLDNPLEEVNNMRETQVLEALSFYYQDLINYVMKNFVEQFKLKNDNLDISDPIPIVISGGTSMPKGFINLIDKSLKKFKDFPYQISEVRYAKDQLNSVALGCMVQAMFEQKKKGK